MEYGIRCEKSGLLLLYLHGSSPEAANLQEYICDRLAPVLVVLYHSLFPPLLPFWKPYKRRASMAESSYHVHAFGQVGLRRGGFYIRRKDRLIEPSSRSIWSR
ncbi:hypothetical protein EUGRSUZ_G02860 [Eucalyptus grandis]|uniref:Uncharacterized protein n=2 Tax=Eucalyptus grandis TaxID=71139 RepID=A0ACC3K874_EUCGR|nr:hypothetical protein EUGRSUZ_G02860 [Eucalyptus grandis]